MCVNKYSRDWVYPQSPSTFEMNTFTDISLRIDTFASSKSCQPSGRNPWAPEQSVQEVVSHLQPGTWLFGADSYLNVFN